MSKQEMLTKELINTSKEYYNNGQSSMSDIEFDAKVEELRRMEEESGVVYPGSPTQNVGVKVDGLRTVKHEYPALSLNKVKYKDIDNLIKWLLKDKQELAVMMWKCDGSTVVLTYDNGSLTSAVTRGNGEEGSDITHNARFFKGIPEKIDYTGHLVVRGEAMMSNEEFDRVNAEAGGIYENARNLATATIQMLDANESKKREIIFKAFELVSPEPEAKMINLPYNGQYSTFSLMSMQCRLNLLSALGFDVVDHELCSSDNILSKVEEWKERIKDLAFPTDGLVISYQDVFYGWSLGSTGHHPRWAMALKWTDETVETTIRDIEWSVGKTGIITPVAIFDEVKLGLGSNVSRASLHNLSIMQNMPSTGSSYDREPIRIGCRAKVYLANLIIPQIASIQNSYDGGQTCSTEPVMIPTKCPVCGGPTEIHNNNGIKTLHCINSDTCPAQQIGKLVNTFSKDGLFVKGLSEKKIQFLVDNGYVSSVLDFYKLKDQGDEGGVLKKDMLGPHLEDQPGWDVKSVDNLINSIEESRNTTLQKFLYSLNIPLLGNDLSKKLSRYWKDDVKIFVRFIDSCTLGTRMEKLAELTAIDGIGEEKALNLIDWAIVVREDNNAYPELMELIQILHFESKESSSEQTLSGLTFVITGNVYEYANRDEFKASVEARGGKVSGSVSAKTSFLVNNDVNSTSGKNQKAKELGIEIISENEFITRFGK